MDDLDAILDEVEITPTAAPADDLDALLDDAMDEVLGAQPTSEAKISNDEDVDNLELKIVSDFDKCLQTLGEKGSVWRQWMNDSPQKKVSSLGPSRAYRSLYTAKDFQDFRTSTHPRVLLKAAITKAATASRVPEQKRQALIEALSAPDVQSQAEKLYATHLLNRLKDAAINDPNYSPEKFPQLSSYYAS